MYPLRAPNNVPNMCSQHIVPNICSEHNVPDTCFQYNESHISGALCWQHIWHIYMFPAQCNQYELFFYIWSNICSKHNAQNMCLRENQVISSSTYTPYNTTSVSIRMYTINPIHPHTIDPIHSNLIPLFCQLVDSLLMKMATCPVQASNTPVLWSPILVMSL